jgi:hypothetical protein
MESKEKEKSKATEPTAELFTGTVGVRGFCDEWMLVDTGEEKQVHGRLGQQPWAGAVSADLGKQACKGGSAHIIY